ncbi:MAG TPA: dipeptide epimerase [Bacteroidia bacterium]|nr:dipeptide epimerase [Bacteroidia bacterium]
MMILRFSPQTLYFKHPFTIAHGTRSFTPIVIVEIELDGFIGYGEASMPPYLGENHETVLEFLKKAAAVLLSANPFEIEAIMKTIDDIDEGNTAAKASIDIALHDLKGKLINEPCWKTFGAKKDDTPYTTFTLGIDITAVMAQKITEAGDFKILKVKLDGKSDKQIIETIRKHTDKPIAVDVNQGWKEKEEALKMIEWLADKNVLFVEQPLFKNNMDDCHWLFERSPLPLFADESVQRFTDIDRIKNCFHGINIKLMKCAGMHEAYKMIDYARQLQLQILIGCMSETSCAISAAAQLTPFADYADLDGCLLMKNDFFKGVEFIEGKITLNNLPGIGVCRI